MTNTPIQQQFKEARKQRLIELGVLDYDGEKFNEGYAYSKLKSIFSLSNDSIRAHYISSAETLWRNLWFENECACIFGDTNIGKTTLAFQIAADVASTGLGVLYFDFENMMHQHYTRNWGMFSDIPDTLYPMYFSQDTSFKDMLSTDTILDSIESEFLENNFSVIVIDDISYLCQMKSTKKASRVLRRFRYWINRYHISILVVAHAMNHRPGTPLTLDHLMGDRQLQYAFDTIISLNRIPRGTLDTGATHYIKQLKSRYTKLIVTAEKVVTMKLKYYYDEEDLQRANVTFPEDDAEYYREQFLNSFQLRFNIMDTDINERRLLYLTSDATEQQQREFINDCYDQGWPIRTIADHTGISKSTVHRILAAIPPKEKKPENCPITPTIDVGTRPASSETPAAPQEQTKIERTELDTQMEPEKEPCQSASQPPQEKNNKICPIAPTIDVGMRPASSAPPSHHNQVAKQQDLGVDVVRAIGS